MTDMISRDLENIWHPYTQMKKCEQLPPVMITNADGVKLYDDKGRFYYDTIASWWCNIHGHNHPRIMDNMCSQLQKLDHVLFAGFTHRPAIELAEKLVKITPGSLEKVFFSDNGSTSVEAALKMSFQYRVNRGEHERKMFVSLDRGFHGDTFGSMSVSGVDLFNEKFKDLFFPCLKVPAPYCYRCPAGNSREDCSMECLSMAEEVISRNSECITAMILEPLLLGAGGMIVYPEEYLGGIRRITKEHDIHLIADEIATGFGKTGSMFACEKAGVEPDLMCLSKGITSGVLPLGATMVTKDIFDAFYADSREHKTFYHGHTFTANPVACTAANTSIDLLFSDRTVENVRGMIRPVFQEFLEQMKELSIVGDARGIGAAAALEIVQDKEKKKPFSPDRNIPQRIYRKGLMKNLILRPLGNVIYLFPPLCVSGPELEDIVQRTGDVIKEISVEMAQST